MTHNINDLVDSNTTRSNSVISDSKSLIEMTLDEYLHSYNSKEEKDKVKAERAIFNYHKKKGHVQSL